jgi:hypothetical protein
MAVVTPAIGALEVNSDSLAGSAALIGNVGENLWVAHASMTAVEAAADAFGGELPGAAFAGVCALGRDALEQIGDTTRQLAQTVAAASVGYVTTDAGVIPAKLLSTDA